MSELGVEEKVTTEAAENGFIGKAAIFVFPGKAAFFWVWRRRKYRGNNFVAHLSPRTAPPWNVRYGNVLMRA